MIIPNNIQSAQGTTAVTLTGRVSSADEVIVITVGNDNGSAAVAKFNGVNLAGFTQLQGINFSTSIFTYLTPPVGNYTISVTDASTDLMVVTAMSLLGVSKRTSTFVTGGNQNAGSANPSLTVQVASANSIIIDSLYYSANPAKANASQTQITAFTDGNLNSTLASYKYVSPGVQTMSIVASTLTGWAYAAIVLEPDDAPSIWYPTVTLRNQTDSDRVYKDNVTTPVPSSAGYFPSTFYQNSFLHTVGRLLPGTPSTPTLVAETELQTSQTVIDRITQQALTSATSITSDHLVSSQDVVMLIFASQMGVAQALNSVTLNGVALNALGNPSTSTLTAGAYYVVNPNVGINTISASATLPTALELIVMTLLGVDKKTTTPIIVSNSGASGSPSSTIQATAANSLLIDFVGSLGTSISENPLQVVYFDQPQVASQAAGSIKLSTLGSQTMSWTTLTSAWVQLVVALEPANALSIWYPSIDPRNLSDVVASNSLDDIPNPVGNFYATFGNFPTQYWQNSFLHTIGRVMPPASVVIAQQPLEYQLLGMG